MKSGYVEKVTELIQNEKARKQIEFELYSHIQDKIDYYVEIGYTREQAEQKANEEMGDPEQTAVPLNSLYNKTGLNFIYYLISSVVLVVLILITYNFSDMFNYSNTEYDVAHKISYDFISVLIFLSYIILLIISRRKKDKIVPMLILISFFIQFASEFIDMLVVESQNFIIVNILQPMVYAIATIITSGFDGYTDNLFIYNTAQPDVIPYEVISMALFAILVIWAILIIVYVFRQERMLSKQNYGKYFKIFEIIFTTAFVANLCLMIYGTAFAFSNIDAKVDEVKNTRIDMIDYVLNADMSKNIDEQMESMKNSGYDNKKCDYIPNDFNYTYSSDSYCYANVKKDNCIALLCFEDDSKYSVAYTASSADNIIEKKLRCTENVKAELSKIEEGISLNEFINTGLYKNAVSANHEIDYDKSELVYFLFYFEDDDKADNYLIFKNDVLINNTMLIQSNEKNIK